MGCVHPPVSRSANWFVWWRTRDVCRRGVCPLQTNPALLNSVPLWCLPPAQGLVSDPRLLPGSPRPCSRCSHFPLCKADATHCPWDEREASGSVQCKLGGPGSASLPASPPIPHRGVFLKSRSWVESLPTGRNGLPAARRRGAWIQVVLWPISDRAFWSGASESLGFWPR